jgi:NADH:ubiquinone oxidoreductase subunit 6 (subunit J)
MWLILLFFSSGALICASRVAQSRNPVYAVMSLVLLFLNAAGLLLIQGMEFFALLQIIVYIGALSVMFLFVVMLLNISLTEIVAYQRATYYTIAQSFLLWVACCAFLLPDVTSSYIVHSPGLRGEQSSISEPRGFVGGENSPLVTKLDTLEELYTNQSFQETMLRELSIKLYLEYADLLIMAGLILLVAMMGAVLLALKKGAKQAPKYNRDFKLVVQSIG